MKTNPQATRGTEANNGYWGYRVAPATKYYNEHKVDFIDDLFDAAKASFPKELKESMGKLFDIVNVQYSDENTHELFKLKFNKGQSTTKNTVSRMAEYNMEIWEHFYHEHLHDLNTGQDIKLPDELEAK